MLHYLSDLYDLPICCGGGLGGAVAAGLLLLN